jgi:type II restriction/modification system DNA methylase subunit YeeA
LGTRHFEVDAQTDRKVRQRYLDQYRADLDREIDHLVYDLYELTDDEIAIVEGKA